MTQYHNKLTQKLLRWYEDNQRVLPWRGSGDPYKIWLSEVIMQQTRVAQGTPYYLKFIENYPTIAHLAAASEQEVLKLWQGLGYYSRGRNLLKAANQLMNDYKGVFPREYENILKIKGIGPYTAAAIVSIAFQKPHAVLDGNVYRVLSRLYGLGMPVNSPGAGNLYQKYADELLDKKKPGTFNEAMMELGALVCLPKNPLCSSCPVAEFCVAKKDNMQGILPQKISLKKVKTRFFHYLFINYSGKFYLRERPAGDIWQGLFELPLIETNDGKMLKMSDIEESFGAKASFLKPLKKTVHKLTHQRLEIIFYETDMTLNKMKTLILTDNKGLKQYPLPKPLELFLNDYLCKSDSII